MISGTTTGSSSADILTDGRAHWNLNEHVGNVVTVAGRGSARILANTGTTLTLGAAFHPPIVAGTPYSIVKNER